MDDSYIANNIYDFFIDTNEKILTIKNNSGSFQIWEEETNTQLSNFNGNVEEIIFSESKEYGLVKVERIHREQTIWYKLCMNSYTFSLLEIPVEIGEGEVSFIKQVKNFWYVSVCNEMEDNNLNYKVNLNLNKWEKIYEGEILDVTVDEKQIIFLERLDFTSFKICLYNTNSKLSKEICTDINLTYGSFINEDTFVYSYNTDSGSKLVLYYISKDLHVPIEFHHNFISNIVHYSEDQLIVTTEYGMIDTIWKFTLSTLTASKIKYPGKVIKKVLVSNHYIYSLMCSPEDKGSIYKKFICSTFWERVTDNCIKETVLMKPSFLKYETFDNLSIEAMLYTVSPSAPTIVWLHGGPHERARATYSPQVQLLLSQGFNVFVPNIRGSTGYGLNFQKLSERNWGNEPAKDVIHGIEYLINKGLIKERRVVFSGISYGGYLSLLLAGKYPEYTLASINLFGPTDLIEFIHHSPTNWKDYMKEWLGDVNEDFALLVNDSPITYYTSISAPILIVYGMDDLRVNPACIEPYINLLRVSKKDVEVLPLQDHGHDYVNNTTEEMIFQKIIDFLRRIKTIRGATNEYISKNL